ncbi:MAG TPA: hypothetical protein VH721_06455 [Gaiellaceae bacterium]|jgi:hypothetical protein
MTSRHPDVSLAAWPLVVAALVVALLVLVGACPTSTGLAIAGLLGVAGLLRAAFARVPAPVSERR